MDSLNLLRLKNCLSCDCKERHEDVGSLWLYEPLKAFFGMTNSATALTFNSTEESTEGAEDTDNASGAILKAVRLVSEDRLFSRSTGNQRWRELSKAVRQDDSTRVSQFLTRVSDSEDFALLGDALRLASLIGSEAVVRELLVSGIDIDEPCPRAHLAPIHLAAAGDQKYICEVLLDGQANVLLRERFENRTPLSIARKFGHRETAKFLSRRTTATMERGPTVSVTSPMLVRLSPALSDGVLKVVPNGKCSKGELTSPSSEADTSCEETSTAATSEEDSQSGAPPPPPPLLVYPW